MFPFKDSVQIENFPLVTLILVILNVLVFAFESVLTPEELFSFVDMVGVIPSEFTSHRDGLEFSRLLSSMFVHGGFLHLAGNMWFLWLFGDGVEDRLGHIKYLLVYLSCGVLAALSQIFVDNNSSVPMIGASGAISGLLGAYYCLFPKATVSTLFLAGIFSRILEIPAAFYLSVWFLMQLFAGIFVEASQKGEANIAFWAHIAGFLAGILITKAILQFRNRNDSSARKPASIDLEAHAKG